MEKFIAQLCDKFIDKHIFPEEEKELYEYCFSVLFMWILYFATCLTIMLYFHCFLAPLTFFIAFFSLRSFMGGWHAPNMFFCFVIGLLLFTITVNLIVYPDISSQEQLIFSCFSVVFTSGILFISNVQDHPNRKLSSQEKQNAKEKCYKLLLIFVTLMLIFALLKRFDLIFSIALACFAATTLLLLAKF